MLSPDDYANAYILSRLADCATPDNPQSPGAAFLLEVADAYRDAPNARPDTPPDELPGEIAAETVYGLLSDFTHSVHLTGTDLCAYREADELADDAGADSLHEYPNALGIVTCALCHGLYVIAERLVQALQTETDDA